MDTIARGVGAKLTDSLGQTIVVDNRGGGGGTIGAELVAAAAPDGYTLIMMSATSVIRPLLYSARYEMVRDFAPISQVSAQPYLLVVHPSMPAKTVQELVAYAKANPGKLNYGSSGPGSTPHLGTELFSSMTGIRMVHVPYKGAGQVITALLSNEVQFAFTNVVSTRPHWQAGRLRFMAHGGAKRLEAFPDVPTIAESGVPGYVTRFWWGYMAPAKTPRPIVTRLHKEITAVANLPDVRQTVVSQGWEVVANTPEEFATIIQSDAEKWGAIGRRLGVKLD